VSTLGCFDIGKLGEGEGRILCIWLKKILTFMLRHRLKSNLSVGKLIPSLNEILPNLGIHFYWKRTLVLLLHTVTHHMKWFHKNNIKVAFSSLSCEHPHPVSDVLWGTSPAFPFRVQSLNCFSSQICSRLV